MRRDHNSGILIDILFSMRSFHFSFDSSREISGAFGLFVVALVALGVGWFVISVGDRIVSGAKRTSVVEMKKQSIESNSQY